MIVLYIGGIKSGKSRLAEKRTLELSSKPLYVATTEIMDDEMSQRVKRHQEQREDAFILHEEGVKIDKALETKETVLLECLSMWLNNMLYYEKSDEEILAVITKILQTSSNRVFVINDVGSSIIPMDALSRRFTDLNGVIAQKVAQASSEVYHCIAGIGTRIV